MCAELSKKESVQLTFAQFPGVYIRLAEISDPAGIKLLICLHLSMGVASGGQRGLKTKGDHTLKKANQHILATKYWQ